MSSTIIDIAEAVKDSLNAGTFSMLFVAERFYVPFHSREQDEDLRVSVVPATRTLTQLTRGNMNEEEYQVDVGVQKRWGDGPMTNDAINAEVDPLMQVTEEIAEHFNTAELEGYGSAKRVEIRNEPIWAPEHMAEKRVFTSVISLIFRLVR